MHPVVVAVLQDVVRVAELELGRLPGGGEQGEKPKASGRWRWSRWR